MITMKTTCLIPFALLPVVAQGAETQDTVRRPDEFKAGHIEGAILIDVTEKDFLAKADSLLDKSRPVAVYCRSGRRSRRAAEMLVEKGYTVHNLNEGYHEWRLYQEGKKP